MRIAVAADHAGFDLKTEIVTFLRSHGHEVVDFGTNSRESVDFVDFVYPAALTVSRGECERAILVDGAGYPSGIVANMLPGVYAAVANDVFSARLSREHSNTNVLCVGGKVVGSGVALEIVATWLEAKFLGGKYAARVAKVEAIAKRHKRAHEEQPRKVITVQDIKDALRRKESLLIDANTIITPSVYDLIQ
jgi:ribose 5-phosphate isomerase B